jgi:hypothetical protein
METIIFVSLIGFLLLTGIGIFNHSKAKSYLNKNLKIDEETINKIKQKFGLEETAAVGVTIFDVLYNTSKLDPFVLKGIDHLHHSQNFESLKDLTSYLKDNIIDSAQGGQAWRQMIHKYKGYTGEEYAFSKLDEKGIDYIKPESGTNPQYDAIVDGQKVDFAITDDPRYIAEKLEDPDIVVYTNKEMASAFGNHPRVIIDDDLSVQELFHKTNETFTGIDDLGDFIDGIPVITALISGVKNTKGIIEGRKDVKTAIEHTASDVAAVGIGGWAGAKIGLAIGLSLAPLTGGLSAVILPLIGSIGGIFTGKGIAKWWKERHLRDAKSNLEYALKDFKQAFIKNYDNIVSTIKAKYNNNKNRSIYAFKNSQNFIGRLLFPKIITKFYKLAAKRFQKELEEVLKMYKELINKIKFSSDYDGGFILYSLGKEILAGDSELLRKYDNVTEKIKIVEKEIKKLS